MAEKRGRETELVREDEPRRFRFTIEPGQCSNFPELEQLARSTETAFQSLINDNEHMASQIAVLQEEVEELEEKLIHAYKVVDDIVKAVNGEKLETTTVPSGNAALECTNIAPHDQSINGDEIEDEEDDDEEHEEEEEGEGEDEEEGDDDCEEEAEVGNTDKVHPTVTDASTSKNTEKLVLAVTQDEQSEKPTRGCLIM